MYVEGEAFDRHLSGQPVPCLNCAGDDPLCPHCLDGLTYPEPDYEAESAVFVGGKRVRLAPSLRIAKHSPTGFSWGYAGSGPAQCALAILLTLTEDPDEAQRWYQQFKLATLARFETGKPFGFWFNFDQWKHWMQNSELEMAYGIDSDGPPVTGIQFVRGYAQAAV